MITSFDLAITVSPRERRPPEKPQEQKGDKEKGHRSGPSSIACTSIPAAAASPAPAIATATAAAAVSAASTASVLPRLGFVHRQGALTVRLAI
jgi:hypothetical protein